MHTARWDKKEPIRMQLMLLKYVLAVVIVLSFIVSASGYAFAAGDDTITETGDVVQILLPLSALAGTYLAKDPEGRAQLAKSFVVGFAIMGSTKVLVDKVRPYETGRSNANMNSFPSGHTWAAFTGASFINRRYGYLYGVPAYLAAGFVGYSRVQAEAHFFDDVVAGASIALLCNWYYTTPYSDKVKVSPYLSNGRYGLKMTYEW